MKLDALDHPKTLDFASRLNVELPTAIGHLELLWAFTAKKAPQGDIGKWPDGAIARACYWMARPESFLQALKESGFLDVDPTHRLIIHDWHEHAPTWVRGKLARTKMDFVGPSDATTRSDLKVSSTAPPTKGREGKGSQAKGSEGQPDLGTPAAAGLDDSAWTTWLDYRGKIRKPLKPVSIPAAQRELAAFGSDQSAVVQQSIANGWQGLFALKRGNGVNGSSRTAAGRRLRTADEIEAEEAARAHP